jgi:hypothetical protein
VAPRPPADAIVALRSLGRRYRGLFAGLEDNESPDDLARRIGSTGRSAFDHVAAASRTIGTQDGALERILVRDSPTLDPMDVDTTEREAEQEPSGTLEERLANLVVDAEGMADRADHVGAADWSRTGSTPDGTQITAAEVLWRAVDAAVDHLKAAEQVLAEVRGR